MQQREQLILKKLAEAREAQASTLTRFIQARTRVMQVEARLQAIRARLAASNMPPAQPAEASTLPPSPAPASIPVNTHPAPFAPHTRLTSDTPTILETPEPLTEQTISDVPTTILTLEQPASGRPSPVPMDESEDEEDTKKQPAILLTRRPTPSTPVARPDLAGEDTLIVALSELSKTQGSSHTEEVQTSAQVAGEASATDITTKIPVIRQERRPSQESTS